MGFSAAMICGDILDFVFLSERACSLLSCIVLYHTKEQLHSNYYIVMYCTTLKNNYILDIISPGEVGKPSILHLVTLTHTMLSLLYVVIFVIILIVDIVIMITNLGGPHYNQNFIWEHLTSSFQTNLCRRRLNVSCKDQICPLGGTFQHTMHQS